MNKQKFNSLDILKQLDYVNAQLKNNMSLRSISGQLEMSKTTIRDRFDKIGYQFDAEKRQYVKVSTMVDNKSIINPKEEIIQNDNKSINKETTITTVDEIKEIELEQVKELKGSLKDIKELIEMKDQLKELIQNYNKSINVIDVQINELKIDKDKFEGELEGRLIKVYENVNKKWKVFCKKNNQFKLQDLYSLALFEFLQRYDK